MKYDLVFEGGGAKGMVFVGAMHEFEARGHEINRLMGTSAGAITATGLAAGYSAAEMGAALMEVRDGKPVFTSFLGVPGDFSKDEIAASSLRAMLEAVDLPLIPERLEARLDEALLQALLKLPRSRHLFSFLERGGWYTADAFVEWMSERLDATAPDGTRRSYSGMTMEAFFEATGRSLSLIAADTSDNHMLILNHHTAPSVPVVWATRMSMSVPLLWQEVVWQEEWGTYRGRDLTGHRIVDGGLLSNFPIELFISAQPHVTAVMGPKQEAGVLGFLIDESLEVPGAAVPATATAGASGGFNFGELPALQRLKGLVDTATQAHDKMVVDAYNFLVCRLPAQGYGTTEFDMTPERRDALVAAGRAAAANHFDNPPSAAIAPGMPFAGAPRGGTPADRLATRMLAE
ncbi:MAG: patatin-like phospholipase family protein [Anaerolineae bacterium]|nr:patatin-like phospholipase family protein [Anaerolineae bacterium]